MLASVFPFGKLVEAVKVCAPTVVVILAKVTFTEEPGVNVPVQPKVVDVPPSKL